MAEQTSGERTEKATPKRREEARKKGNVAKSSEVNAALVLLTGILMLTLMSNHFMGNIQALMREVFINLPSYKISPESLRIYSVQIILFLVNI